MQYHWRVIVFDKYIKEYKASLQLSIYEECEDNSISIVITDTDNNSGTISLFEASNNRNTKRSEATSEKE